MSKIAVLVFADTETHADMGRMSNGLEIVKEFKEAGDEATLIFDGAGTKWAAALPQPGHPLHKLYSQVEDHVGGVCKFCAAAFHVTQEVQNAGMLLLGEHDNHPSVRNLVAQDYEIITL